LPPIVRPVRTMFVVYCALILAGITTYVAVGLTHS
jgi:hypothetical protein